MDLDQIRALLAVARRGSISRAARDLYRTQPAVSLKLRALEEELGQRLLERRPRGVSLTAAGAVFRRRADAIVAQIEALTSELADLSARRAGHVSLGASDTVCLYLLPAVLKRFVRKYPGIDLGSVKSSKVSGSTAVVVYQGPSSAPLPFQLTKQDGNWKVSGPARLFK